jgi:hypothetical protein
LVKKVNRLTMFDFECAASDVRAMPGWASSERTGLPPASRRRCSSNENSTTASLEAS